MTFTDKEKEFLAELGALSLKYGIYVSGCGCCNSPYLEHDLDGEGYGCESDPTGSTVAWCHPKDCDPGDWVKHKQPVKKKHGGSL